MKNEKPKLLDRILAAYHCLIGDSVLFNLEIGKNKEGYVVINGDKKIYAAKTDFIGKICLGGVDIEKYINTGVKHGIKNNLRVVK